MKLNVLFIGFLLLSSGAGASETIDIQRFGQDGDLTPRIMGYKMPEHFFVSPRHLAISNGKNYVSKVQIPKMVLTEELNLGRGDLTVVLPNQQATQAMELLLVNEDVDFQDLVVSAESALGEVENFLVRVEAFSDLALDLSHLSQFSHFYVISSRPAVAWLAQEDTVTELAWDVPEVDTFSASKSAAGYCNDTGRWKRLRSVADGGEVIAYFERFFDGYTPTTIPRSYYGMAIHWPNIGDVFHGPYSVTLDPSTSCRSIDYTTINFNGLKNWWRGNIDEAIMYYSGEAYGCVVNGSCSESEADWQVLRYPDF